MEASGFEVCTVVSRLIFVSLAARDDGMDDGISFIVDVSGLKGSTSVTSLLFASVVGRDGIVVWMDEDLVSLSNCTAGIISAFSRSVTTLLQFILFELLWMCCFFFGDMVDFDDAKMIFLPDSFRVICFNC